MGNGQISMMDILVETYKRLYSKYKQHCGYAFYIGKKYEKPIKITSAARDEIFEIAAFLDECWKVEYRGIVAPDFLGDLSVEERHKKLLGRFNEGTSAFLIMRDGEKMIGASVFGKSFTEGYPEDGEISAIYLHHDYIGKGYGHHLFTKSERELTAKGYSHFVLDVLSANTRAISFYEKHGYEKVDDRSIALGAHNYPLTVFRKNNPTGKACLDGAKETGAETELINLYDINFKGCTSCFACKRKGITIDKCAMKDNKKLMTRTFGSSESLAVTSTYQFDDYSKYAMTFFDGAKRLKRRETVFVEDCKNAFLLGKRLCEK